MASSLRACAIPRSQTPRHVVRVVRKWSRSLGARTRSRADPSSAIDAPTRQRTRRPTELGSSRSARVARRSRCDGRCLDRPAGQRIAQPAPHDSQNSVAAVAWADRTRDRQRPGRSSPSHRWSGRTRWRHRRGAIRSAAVRRHEAQVAVAAAPAPTGASALRPGRHRSPLRLRRRCARPRRGGSRRMAHVQLMAARAGRSLLSATWPTLPPSRRDPVCASREEVGAGVERSRVAPAGRRDEIEGGERTRSVSLGADAVGPGRSGGRDVVRVGRGADRVELLGEVVLRRSARRPARAPASAPARPAPDRARC